MHDSGESRRPGRITKAGRRGLRPVMIEAAHSAARTHPHWKAELRRLEPRLGRKKAIVATPALAAQVQVSPASSWWRCSTF